MRQQWCVNWSDICALFSESKIKTRFPRDYEFSAELKKQLPKFTWPMRVPK